MNRVKHGREPQGGAGAVAGTAGGPGVEGGEMP